MSAKYGPMLTNHGRCRSILDRLRPNAAGSDQSWAQCGQLWAGADHLWPSSAKLGADIDLIWTDVGHTGADFGNTLTDLGQLRADFDLTRANLDRSLSNSVGLLFFSRNWPCSCLLLLGYGRNCRYSCVCCPIFANYRRQRHIEQITL